MTELDTQTLRRALRTQQDPGEPVDIAAIIGRGRSLRRRRRYVAIAGVACAAAAIFGALTAITHLTRPGTAPARYPVISGRTVPTPPAPFPARHTSPPAVITPTPKVAPSATPTAVPSPSRSGSDAMVPNPSPTVTVGTSRAVPSAVGSAPLASPTR